jgi:tetrahydromethanopterin S-methyltransferase subunit H
MRAMEAKEQQMVAIGARIITDRADRETAEAARIRFASENSVLGDVVGNLSDALTKCIGWVGDFMGVDVGDSRFIVNREFYDRDVDPQMLMSMVTLLDRDIIAEKDIFDRLKSGGLVNPERSLDDVRDESGMANPIDER